MTLSVYPLASLFSLVLYLRVRPVADLRGLDLKGLIQFQIKSYSQSQRKNQPGAKPETELEEEVETKPGVET